MDAVIGVPPFVAALGERANTLPPALRAHFALGPGAVRYEGVMRRVRRRGGLLGPFVAVALRLAARRDTLFPEQGDDIPFRIEHVVTAGPDGRLAMTWNRVFRFPHVTRRFVAVMRADAERGCVVDWLGSDAGLEVELHADVVDDAIHIVSGRQWVCRDDVRVALPDWAAGTVRVRESVGPDGRLHIRVTATNPLIGTITSYEGDFALVDAPPADPVLDPGVSPRPPAPARSFGGLAARAAVAVLGATVAGVALARNPEVTPAPGAALLGLGAAAVGAGFAATRVSAVRLACVGIDALAAAMGVLSALLLVQGGSPLGPIAAGAVAAAVFLRGSRAR